MILASLVLCCIVYAPDRFPHTSVSDPDNLPTVTNPALTNKQLETAGPDGSTTNGSLPTTTTITTSSQDGTSSSHHNNNKRTVRPGYSSGASSIDCSDLEDDDDEEEHNNKEQRRATSRQSQILALDTLRQTLVAGGDLTQTVVRIEVSSHRRQGKENCGVSGNMIN